MSSTDNPVSSGTEVEDKPDLFLRINGSDTITLSGPRMRKLAAAVYRVLQGQAVIIEIEGVIYRQTPGEELP
jgi:hypothetical protein